MIRQNNGYELSQRKGIMLKKEQVNTIAEQAEKNADSKNLSGPERSQYIERYVELTQQLNIDFSKILAWTEHRVLEELGAVSANTPSGNLTESQAVSEDVKVFAVTVLNCLNLAKPAIREVVGDSMKAVIDRVLEYTSTVSELEKN